VAGRSLTHSRPNGECVVLLRTRSYLYSAKRGPFPARANHTAQDRSLTGGDVGSRGSFRAVARLAVGNAVPFRALGLPSRSLVEIARNCTRRLEQGRQGEPASTRVSSNSTECDIAVYVGTGTRTFNPDTVSPAPGSSSFTQSLAMTDNNDGKFNITAAALGRE